MTLPRETQELVRKAAVARWEAESDDELIIFVDAKTVEAKIALHRVRETNGGYWVPALVFVSHEEVTK